MTPNDIVELRLSSRATTWYRWGMPVLAGLIGLKFASIVWVAPSTKMATLFGVAGVLILGAIASRAFWLADVWLRGDSLEIRQLGRMKKVPLDAIRVQDTGTWWSSLIVLIVHQEHRHSRTVAFLPAANSAGLLPRSDDGVIRELRRRLR